MPKLTKPRDEISWKADSAILTAVAGAAAI
jgi:hypothetical protein